DFETICLKALAKAPGRRYTSALELADDLRRFLRDEPIAARPIGRVERLGRWCRRNPMVASLVTVIAMSLLAGTTISSYFAAQATQEKERADKKAAEAVDKAAEARTNQYVAHMNLAPVEWQNGNVGHVIELLDRYRQPRANLKDLRGWEWFYQDRLCHEE